MRSLLFVPGDSDRKLAKALDTGADALIVDLEDSVAAAGKEAARRTTTAFLSAAKASARRPLLLVRVNALDTGLTDADLDAVMAAAPDAVMLPKASGGTDIAHVGAKLAVREAENGLADGHTRIVGIATETARSLFGLGTFAGASPRLIGLAWGAEDLSADLGAQTNRAADGGFAEPYRLARSLLLFGAVAAGVAPIDSIFSNFRDLDGLRRECEEAVRDGFTAKMAIHPGQVAVINAAFTPSSEAIQKAKAVVAAFADNPQAGVLSLDGEMLDRPHLTRAERLLSRIAPVQLS